MEKIFLVLSLFAFAISSQAQSNKEDVAIIQSMFGKEKKELVAEYLVIPETQKEKFWTLYDQYEDKRKELGRERISLIETYANNYATMDDKKAASLMTAKIAWTEKYLKLQHHFFPKFTSVIGGKNSAKLLQLEEYLETNIRILIQEEIPFIDELDKTKLPATSK